MRRLGPPERDDTRGRDHMKTLLFIHGSGCTGDAFRHQTDFFEGSHAPNLPGHQSAGAATSVAQFADFIEEYIAQHTLADVVLCGNSLGGAIALEVALRKNPSLSALIALGSGSRLRVAPAFLEGLAERFDETAAELARYMFADPTPERVAYALESMRSVGQKQTLADFAACNDFDVTQHLPEIGIPMLALTGERDVMTPPKYAQALADRVQHGQVRIVPGAGHLAMLEQPATTNDAVSAFVMALA